jgi:uncharacterized protein (DUF305 family)
MNEMVMQQAHLVDSIRRSARLASAILVSALLSGTPAFAQEQAFMAENEQAMTRMMSGMSVAPSGDVDRDFAAMMIPHHRGAVDMALAELRFGRNEQLRRLAKEIIVTQQDEIRVMQSVLDSVTSKAKASTVPNQGQAMKPDAR